MITIRKFLFLVMIVFVFIASNAFALPGIKQWKLTWTANTETDLDHYSMYWRVSGGSFTDVNKVASIPKTQTSQVLTGVVPNNCEIALTASDTSGNESAFSVVVPFVKDGSAPGGPSGLAVVPAP